MMNPQAMNRYSYVWGNPLKYVDPTGLFTRRELLAYGVDADVIAEWENDRELWEFIYQANVDSEFTRTWGGTVQRYWFDIVFESLCGNQCPEGAEVDPIQRLVLRQTGVGGDDQTNVGTILKNPGVISYENPWGDSVDIVVGHGKAFVARGDAYALKYYAAAGLNAVATGGQALGVWGQGCNAGCLTNMMTMSYAYTQNPVAAIAVLGAYQLGVSAKYWAPELRQRADWLRR